ncbi:MAG: [citrate (pro-3S)-lyase] ligase [Pelosinus sp.]|nr:[citrate (pro-3S)-lyase] ligase [Pelosinus sp.]
MLWDNIEKRDVNLASNKDVLAVQNFLSRFDLTFAPEQIEYTTVFLRNEKIVATGSLAGEVLRNIAVDESLQGEGVTASVVSELITQAVQRSRYHYFIFTKPDKSHLFGGLGFNEIARVEPYCVLLESGLGSIKSFCQNLAKQAAVLPAGKRAALVMNCNPFTLGHKALIEKAAAENEAVIVLVVSEENSAFPFAVRKQLIEAGVKEYNNVLVIPGGGYVISAATFPGYFTKGEATILAQTRLDAAIFGKYIAPALKIQKRYIGEEPYCPTTRTYNEALQEVLPAFGIEVCQTPRFGTEQAISASEVRSLIRCGDDISLAKISSMVPSTTYEFLLSEEAKPILAKIRANVSRH